MITLLTLLACEAPDYGAGPQVYAPPVPHEGDDWLFSHQRINRIDIRLDPDAEEILRAERPLSAPRNEVRGLVEIDGEEVGEVGVRLRGHLGSFRRYDKKPKWKLDLNEFSGERFHGLEALSLNNGVQDPSMLREVLAHEAFRAAGLPASRSGYAQLFVNERDYGLYVLLETQDDRWLRRLAEEGVLAYDHGNLYDGSYLHAGWAPLGLDLGTGRDALFDLEEGTDIDAFDLRQVSTAVSASMEAGSWDPSLRTLVDWEEVIPFLVMEQWVGNTDSYRVSPNNYKVYFEPGGAMLLNPWDVDLSFGGRPASDPRWREETGGVLAVLCLRDEACAAAWASTARDLADAMDALSWQQRLDDLAELSREGADGDPRGAFTPAQREEDRAAVRHWLGIVGEDLRYLWRAP